jgi:hypothetical protein
MWGQPPPPFDSLMACSLLSGPANLDWIPGHGSALEPRRTCKPGALRAKVAPFQCLE